MTTSAAASAKAEAKPGCGGGAGRYGKQPPRCGCSGEIILLVAIRLLPAKLTLGSGYSRRYLRLPNVDARQGTGSAERRDAAPKTGGTDENPDRGVAPACATSDAPAEVNAVGADARTSCVAVASNRACRILGSCMGAESQRMSVSPVHLYGGDCRAWLGDDFCITRGARAEHRYVYGNPGHSSGRCNNKLEFKFRYDLRSARVWFRRSDLDPYAPGFFDALFQYAR